MNGREKKRKMSVYLYRLFAVQTFGEERVAVYVNEGNYPDPEILSDATEICRGVKTRKEIFKFKPWVYEGRETNKRALTFYTRLILRSRKIIEKNQNVDKAIFVESTYHKTWRGTNTLYYNKYFDEVKSDTPEFSGCEAVGEIIL